MYTAGRDGMVASWDLDIPHTRRTSRRYSAIDGRNKLRKIQWEFIGDGADFFRADEEDREGGSEVEGEGDGDESWVDMKETMEEIPFEDRYEVDKAELSKRSPKTTFRQSSQTHTDWVNSLLLCNYNRTVITASSDRTIRAWTPHSSLSASSPSGAADPSRPSPALVGTHTDFVKSLAFAEGPGYLWSGSLDQKICLWDIQQGSGDCQPILDVDLQAEGVYGGGVYTLAIDKTGSTLAAGTTERIVRLYDARAGPRSTGHLVGHEDRVRSMLFSDDGKYMLSASSDSTIKLWSLAAHRCVHTFTHHDSPVWALHSNHPNFERFYSGSRDGRLCVVDVEGCRNLSGGEAVLLAGSEPETQYGERGIRSIVAMDDEYVWTSSGMEDVVRWKDVGRRVGRLDKVFDGASYRSPVQAGGAGMEREPGRVAFASSPRDPLLGGEASVSALSANVRDRLAVGHRSTLSNSSLVSSSASTVAGDDDRGDEGQEQGEGGGDTGLTRNGIPYESLINLSVDRGLYGYEYEESTISISGDYTSSAPPPAQPLRPSALYAQRDLACLARPIQPHPPLDDPGIIRGRTGLIRSEPLNDRIHVLTADADGQVALWNIVKGICVGVFDPKELCEALHISPTPSAEASRAFPRTGPPLEPEVEAVRIELRRHSQDVLNMIREHVQGMTSVSQWFSSDTKTGSLAVHIEERTAFVGDVYLNDIGLKVEGGEGGEDQKINLGQWTLANLFRGFIAAEEHEVISHLPNSPSTLSSSLPSTYGAPNSNDNANHLRSPTITTSIDRPPISPGHRKRALTGSFSGTRPPAASLVIPGLVSPAARPAVELDMPTDVFGSSGSIEGKESLLRSISGRAVGTPGGFSIGSMTSPGLLGEGIPIASSATNGNGGRDYFSPRKKTEQTVVGALASSGPGSGDREGSSSATKGQGTPSTPGGSFMGRIKIKNFGKKKAAEVSMPAVQERAATPEDTGPKRSERDIQQLEMLDNIRAHHFHPPPPWEAPYVAYPPSTTLLISEVWQDTGAWVVTYRSEVGSTERDMEPLETNSPGWLLWYLFTNTIPPKPQHLVNIRFKLEPFPGSELPELPRGESQVNAPKTLRCNKVYHYVAERLNAINEAQNHRSKKKKLTAEDIDLVIMTDPEIGSLDYRMTVGTVKAYYAPRGDYGFWYSLRQKK